MSLTRHRSCSTFTEGMKKKYISLVAIVAILCLYELAFRYWTGKNGEVNTNDTPPTLYYSSDLTYGFPIAERIFTWRANLSLGKVRLAKGTGAYISGGEFYRKNNNGSWVNLSDMFTKYSESMREPVGGDQ